MRFRSSIRSRQTRASSVSVRESGAARALRGLIRSVARTWQPRSGAGGRGQLEAQPLVHAIAGGVQKGARYVDVQYFDGAVKRIRAENAREETLDWVPPWLGRRMELLGDLDAVGARSSARPPGLLDGVDPARAGLDAADDQETFKTIDERSIGWKLSPFRRARGARMVYPEVEAPKGSIVSGATSCTSAAWTSPTRPKQVRPDRGDLPGGGRLDASTSTRSTSKGRSHRPHRRACCVVRFAKEGARRRRVPVSARAEHPTKRCTRRPIRERRTVVTATKAARRRRIADRAATPIRGGRAARSTPTRTPSVARRSPSDEARRDSEGRAR